MAVWSRLAISLKMHSFIPFLPSDQVRVQFPFDFLNAIWSLSTRFSLSLNPGPMPLVG